MIKWKISILCFLICSFLVMSCNSDTNEHYLETDCITTPSRTTQLTNTPTTLPIITSPLKSTKAPDRPIDPEGPWILSYKDYEYIRLCNIDGTGSLILSTPLKGINFNLWGEKDEDIIKRTLIALSLESEEEQEIWIIRLPEGEIIKKISLIGKKARNAIEEYQPPDLYPYLTTSPVEFAIGKFLWSPNNRYLAFVGAMDGPSADVYLYDSQTNEIHQLTSGPYQAVLMSWSPDSQYVVHYSAKDFLEFHTDIESFWIADVTGSIKRLYDLNRKVFGIWIIDWISPDTYITHETFFELNPNNLALVNIKTGEISTIEVDRFLSVFFDEPAQRFFINWGVSMGWAPEDAGVYEYDLESNKIIEFMPGVKLQGRIEHTDFYYGADNEQTYIISNKGELIAEFEFTHQIPLASPNGNWIVVSTPGNTVVLDEKTNTVTSWDFECNYPYWSSDSSEFYCFIPIRRCWNIIQASEKNNWKPELINTIDEGGFIIIQP